MSMFTVAALYHFAPFDDPGSLRAPLLDVCQTGGVKGTLLLAREGINGTIAGQQAGIDSVLTHIRTLPGCAELDVKFSSSTHMPFHRMKVRLKKEIVTLGIPGIDPSRDVGRYVDALEWNALISDPATIVIDTRNDYEVKIGTFKGALDPGTRSFSQFPDWFRTHRAQFGNNPKVAMFCTGGIRGEKSTAFLRAEGIEDVAHLKGGILKYLETVPQEESLWEGECFVFDERVSVGHGLAPGEHTTCHACRRPLAPADRLRPEYEEGVRCHQCAGEYSEDRREGFRERHRQMTGRGRAR